MYPSTKSNKYRAKNKETKNKTDQWNPYDDFIKRKQSLRGNDFMPLSDIMNNLS